MKIGVAFPTTEIGSDPAVIRDFAQAVEELGYDHLTIIDHVLQAGEPEADDWRAYYTRDNMFHEPLVTLGYLSGVTSRIGLATAILILPQRPTVLVAKQAAELDVLCGGRLRLGVGIGWNALEFDAMGQNFKNRANRMVEQIQLMRALWSNELVDFQGEWHRIENSGINPLPVQRPIPVWIGAFAPPAIERAAREGDGWFVNPRLDPGDEAERLVDVFRNAAVGAGRNPDTLGMDATLHLGDRGPEEWAKLVEEWRRLGATHGTVRTMYSGFDTVEKHIEGAYFFPWRTRALSASFRKIEASMDYRYLLLVRFLLINVISASLLTVAYFQGWLSGVFSDSTREFVLIICAVFLYGFIICTIKIWQTCSELDEVKTGHPDPNSRAGKFLATIYNNDSEGRSIGATVLRTKLTNRIAIVRHIANALVLLGLIGTVVGFIIALSAVDASTTADSDTIAPTIARMISGMSVALYTTLVGSVLHIWLIINHRILTTGTVNLYSAIVELGEIRGRT